ncbi:hypothetical protein ABZP36_000511 [Zizania latifolia]
MSQLVPTAAIPRLVPPPSIDITMPVSSPPPPPLFSVNRNMGGTGTGKTRLAVDLALRFGGEVINADKTEVYKGVDVATNKVTAEECAGVPHHLLGVAHPADAEFTAVDFRREESRAAGAVTARGRRPIIAGGSNSYIDEVIDGDRRALCERYDCFFLCVDVQSTVLHGFVGHRVDEMCGRGLVDEVAAAFDPRRTDYSRGIWCAIGVPELDAYLRSFSSGDDEERAWLLAIAIEEIKANTRQRSCRQRAKIQRLAAGWPVASPPRRHHGVLPAALRRRRRGLGAARRC